MKKLFTKLHIPYDFISKKKHVHCVLGIIVMFAGSYISTLHLQVIPHLFTDVIGYWLHGFGSVPIIKIVCEFLEIEM